MTPFPLFLALKYLKPKRTFASVILAITVLGVALGVAILMIVLAVMTGFGDEWREKILSFKPHITVSHDAGYLAEADAVADRIAAVDGVVADVTKAEDRALEEEMMASEKERAEHLMLVDLARNDLGRVCSTGSVKVTELMGVESYSHVMHIVSQVEGNRRPGLSSLDVLQAAFPAGTVSGAPKIRAMEIIEELEGTARGPYAGAVGYLGFDGNLDTCITIRTLVQEGENVHVQAGAGIVYDSVPEREYEETQNKARALFKALQTAMERGNAE